MTTRASVVAVANSFVGYLEGAGNANEFSTWDGRPPEAWCFDFCDAVFRLAGAPLPSMQTGVPQGAAAVGAGFAWAQQHGILRPSVQAEPGDLIGFQWDGTGLSGNPANMHVEVCTDRVGSALSTTGGNSGPSPGGRDGVHSHTWTAGAGTIIGAIDTSKIVSLADDPPPQPDPVHRAPGGDPNPWHPHRLIRVTNHTQVWQMRLTNGTHLVKAPVPSPVVLGAQLAAGQTLQVLIDKQSNLGQLAAIPTVPWS
jgi:cell wall-associated NlpC family hydrolase